MTQIKKQIKEVCYFPDGINKKQVIEIKDLKKCVNEAIWETEEEILGFANKYQGISEEAIDELKHNILKILNDKFLGDKEWNVHTVEKK